MAIDGVLELPNEQLASVKQKMEVITEAKHCKAIFHPKFHGEERDVDLTYCSSVISQVIFWIYTCSCPKSLRVYNTNQELQDISALTSISFQSPPEIEKT